MLRAESAAWDGTKKAYGAATGAYDKVAPNFNESNKTLGELVDAGETLAKKGNKKAAEKYGKRTGRRQGPEGLGGGQQHGRRRARRRREGGGRPHRDGRQRDRSSHRCRRVDGRGCARHRRARADGPRCEYDGESRPRAGRSGARQEGWRVRRQPEGPGQEPRARQPSGSERPWQADERRPRLRCRPGRRHEGMERKARGSGQHARSSTSRRCSWATKPPRGTNRRRREGLRSRKARMRPAGSILSARRRSTPVGKTQVDALGKTQVDALGKTQVDALGKTQDLSARRRTSERRRSISGRHSPASLTSLHRPKSTRRFPTPSRRTSR